MKNVFTTIFSSMDSSYLKRQYFFGSIVAGLFFIFSVVKISFLYIFSIFIAPFGLIYIYYNSTSVYNIPDVISMKYWQRVALNIGVFLFLVYSMNRVYIMSWVLAIVVTVGLSVLSTLVRPVISTLSLPVTVISLGLAYLVINSVTIWLASYFVIGIVILSFVQMLVFSLIMSITNLLISDAWN